VEVEYLQVGQLVGLVGHLDGGCGCVFGGCGVAENGATAPDVEWLGLLEPKASKLDILIIKWKG